jgi:hypothetical protein
MAVVLSMCGAGRVGSHDARRARSASLPRGWPRPVSTYARRLPR